jgi:RNA recognition motif-containing protein
MRICVGNLTVPITEDDLRQLFVSYGGVAHVQILADQATGQAQGFVEMPDTTAAQTAMEGLQGTRLHGRTLTIQAARWQW